MTGFLPYFRFFISPAGLLVLGALDSSFLFVLPLALDAVIIILTVDQPEGLWLYPLLATVGSLLGAWITYWLGGKLGEAGLKRLVSPGILSRVRKRAHRGGAVAMAIPGVLPPPFPLKPFVLVSGALKVERRRFFGTLGAVRLLRFSADVLLAVLYGERVLRFFESERVQAAIAVLIIVAFVGMALSIYHLARR